MVLAETSTFIDNEAEFGGALYGFATLTVESTFAENAAVQGGANASVYYAAVVDSTFVGNTAEEIGGALVAADFAVIQNSTFVDTMGARSAARSQRRAARSRSPHSSATRPTRPTP